MFGLGRRRPDEVKKLKEREVELEKELDQTRTELLDAKSKVDQLSSHSRVLSAKVHRLTLQQYKLQEENDQLVLKNRDLQVDALKYENEAALSKKDDVDSWQVMELKSALRRQAVQHETKMESLKRRTKALLTAVLPGSRMGSRTASMGGGMGAKDGMSVALNQSGSSPSDSPEHRAAPSAPSPAAALPDLWGDAPLPAASASPDVNAKVRQVIACLYDDTLSEDQALEQLTSLAAGLRIEDRPRAASRACSPLPFAHLAGGVDEGDGPCGPGEGVDKVDASTEAGCPMVHMRAMADAATETPAEMSYMPTPSRGATPSAHSPRRPGPPVPPLNLAALLSQAMESGSLSARSNASASVGGAAAAGGGGSSSFTFSQFVLAQPDKLQRLIMRHAAAVGHRGAEATAPQHHQPLFTGSALGSGAHPGPALHEPLAPTTSGGSMTSRITNRLLGGFGTGAGSSFANTNANPSTHRPPQPPAVTARDLATAAPSTAATAGVVLPSAPSPSKAGAGKRPGLQAAPKFAVLDKGAPSAPMGGKAAAGAGTTTVELKPLWGRQESSSSMGSGPMGVGMGGGGSPSGGMGGFGRLGGMLGGGAAGGGADLDGEFRDLFPGSSAALAPRR